MEKQLHVYYSNFTLNNLLEISEFVKKVKSVFVNKEIIFYPPTNQMDKDVLVGITSDGYKFINYDNHVFVNFPFELLGPVLMSIQTYICTFIDSRNIDILAKSGNLIDLNVLVDKNILNPNISLINNVLPLIIVNQFDLNHDIDKVINNSNIPNIRMSVGKKKEPTLLETLPIPIESDAVAEGDINPITNNILISKLFCFDSSQSMALGYLKEKLQQLFAKKATYVVFSNTYDKFNKLLLILARETLLIKYLQTENKQKHLTFYINIGQVNLINNKPVINRLEYFKLESLLFYLYKRQNIWSINPLLKNTLFQSSVFENKNYEIEPSVRYISLTNCKFPLTVTYNNLKSKQRIIL
ncbi:hypothetical protein SGHV007 [Glossina pallidipes salivary gland hypertrophy virus]|uniref:Uncharacterized protein n=1 Tax=Glossina hytrovirus (isolate Glossina pallidipes/Ethiopia/Seibersdorf/-) TaxID=379529 RepID=B0YLG1_GHVS|nr:hypothetical protein SGHV007 [Glossina pallidipes salivary gland hypertrophy virus]ABQ08780.1 hypothetical protein SGHV007 [Glossina pallidipes salivary gland hypertrophy virus]